MPVDESGETAFEVILWLAISVFAACATWILWRSAQATSVTALALAHYNWNNWKRPDPWPRRLILTMVYTVGPWLTLLLLHRLGVIRRIY